MTDWERLGRYVVSRRVELGYTQRLEFAEATRISARVLSDIENGRRGNYDQVTIAKIEQGLGWATGSVARVSQGGEPEPRAGLASEGPPSPRTAILDEGYLSEVDDPVTRILNSSAPADVKQTIIKRLLAEQRSFAQRRVDELLREALQKE